MPKSDYISRKKLMQDAENLYFRGKVTLRELIATQPSADVVPWSWLREYAKGKRCNYASDFITEAKEAWNDAST